MIAPAPRPALVPIDRIVTGLAARAAELATELLPGGHREGEEWCVGSKSSPFGCSASVHLRGSKAGVWSAWAADEGGDALDLVAAVRFAGDKREALRWAVSWLGLDGLDPRRLQTTDRAIEARHAAPAEPDAKAKRDAAFRWWLAGTPLVPGDEAHDYLAKTRGIDLAALGRVPRVLRFVRALPNIEAGRKFPALIAGVFDRHGKLLTIHRTWLERQTTGQILKAPIAEPRKVYGAYRGGLIPLWRGASDRPWKDPPPDDVLGLAEGIEDGLVYASEVLDHRVAAAISVGNLSSLTLHPALRDLIIAADNDLPGSPASQSLDRAVARFLAEGRKVRIARVPEGFKDLNDLLLRSAGAA